MNSERAAIYGLAALTLVAFGSLGWPGSSLAAGRDLKAQAQIFHQELVDLYREIEQLTDLTDRQEGDRQRIKKDLNKSKNDWQKQASNPDLKAKKAHCDYAKRLLEAIVDRGLPIDTTVIPGEPPICEEC